MLAQSTPDALNTSLNPVRGSASLYRSYQRVGSNPLVGATVVNGIFPLFPDRLYPVSVRLWRTKIGGRFVLLPSSRAWAVPYDVGRDNEGRPFEKWKVRSPAKEPSKRTEKPCSHGRASGCATKAENG